MTTGKAAPHDPIDAVYTWVDGSDPEFQEQLRQCRAAPGAAGIGALDGRFRDHGELRFSLRSLERYAPWIRKVHLVTNGQAPAWIDRSHPRLALVRHQDLFRDRSVLPVFNPRAIEWQLFRIPGISPRFLYFDDDCFLGRRIAPGDFLTPKGGHRFFAEEDDIPPGAAAESLLNARFGNHSPRKKPAHTPRFLDRSFLEEVNRLWEGQIKRTAAHRFPDAQDVALDVLYFYYLLECPQQYGVHERTSAAGQPKTYRFVPLSSPAETRKQMAGILFTRPKFFCLHDATGGADQQVVRRYSVPPFLTSGTPSSLSSAGVL